MEFESICPRKVFEYNQKNNTLTVEREKDCMFCYECENLAVKQFNLDRLVKVEDGDYIFDIESNGALRPDEIVFSAFERLDLSLIHI